jgi:RHS repeat-associated protein
MDYGAFGQHQSSQAWFYGFTGREYDHNTGLNYHRARWLDTSIGRWINEDPIGFAGGDANLNRYVAHRVTTHVDPSGMADGHHYVNRATIRDLYEAGLLMDEARDVFEAAVTGETVPRHNYGQYGGVKHSEYNQLCKQAALKEYNKLKKTGQLKGGKMTGPQATSFVNRLKASGAGDLRIKAFNTAVQRQIRTASVATTLASGLAAGTVVQGAQAADVITRSKHFAEAINALQRGDLDKATRCMTFDNKSVYSDLVDANLPIAGLSLRVYWDKMKKWAKEQ